MNKTAITLFQQRHKAIRKEKSYYNKFIFNGHFSVFLLILLGAFILGYGQWLKHIPSHIDYALFASLILAITSIFPIRTFLKDADRLFLLPFEKHMKAYMSLSLRYSYFNRIIIQIVLLIVLFPLFYKLNHGLNLGYILFIVLVLIHPFLGLLLRWKWYQSHLSSWSLNIILFILNGLAYYLVLGYQMYWGIIFTIILLLAIFLLPKMKHSYLFPWERMVLIEERHHTNYYKFVNMFTDVKHLKETAVRRQYLDFLLPTPKGQRFSSKNMYLYLFTRSFVRGRDAFTIILRLVVIALILMIWLSFPIVTVIIGSLFMYIILLQMSQFYTQQAYGLWPQVWPVSDAEVIKGYEKFLYRLMIIIGVIFSITFIIIYPQYFIFAIVFFIVGWLTIRSTIKKLQYQESLLKD
ncbi:ABC transporter permease [Staphylococcus sp. NRL 16/872]|uniref:ABC transporter permease EcsB n=1 Tax=Staphylococcus sp. NRL 16/872 TaxID=2930131 RepID=UPI001FB55135|nr:MULTISPECIES: ABC transporter permease [unclassified Staphylococcus]MCJ1656060.1 ABC transporter permease [Staphylococcus sp. NRL 21/187]MCJ1667807.1 ABC transporter permease [Staphylococcus sp. NRL 19/737]WEN70297.1 ABC transporter permease [Staphylococcus sp. NRL 16/872]